MIALCESHYFSRMDYVLNKMATCLPAARNRRDLGPLTAVAVDVIGHGLTNFVKSYFFPGRTDSTNYEAEIYHNLRKQTMSILESRDARTSEITKAITAFSESSSYHPDEVAVEAAHVDTQYGASVQIFFENVAGFANLRTLYNSCKDGRVATRELGELLGNREIAEINSEDTRLDNVLVNPSQGTIHLICREKIHEDLLAQNVSSHLDHNSNLVMLDRLLDKIHSQTKQEPNMWFVLFVSLSLIPFILIAVILIHVIKVTSKSSSQNIELAMKSKPKKLNKDCDDSD